MINNNESSINDNRDDIADQNEYENDNESEDNK